MLACVYQRHRSCVDMAAHDTSCRRKAEWALMLAFGLGLLSLVLISHSHLSVVPHQRHAHHGRGHRHHLRTALEFDTVSCSQMLCDSEETVDTNSDHACVRVWVSSRLHVSAADYRRPAWGGCPAHSCRAAASQQAAKAPECHVEHGCSQVRCWAVYHAGAESCGCCVMTRW